jgi:pyruvate dehydrogenase E1 component beta subunit
MRKITYAQAINEALEQVMQKDKKVFVIGQGVTSPWYVGSTCEGLVKKFGEKRVIDTPVSENAVTGTAVGAALSGARPVLIFPRMDFMYLAMDQIINQAANWHYMFGGKVNVPLVIRGIINRGGEQAAQHSQAIQAIFAHIPGLKVVMPSTPYDAKGLLISAIYDGNPVVYIDDSWLYKEEGNVPQKIYKVPIGKGFIRKRGKNITVVATSYMVPQAIIAAKELKKERIDAEILDLRTIKPLDKKLILNSVKKTGRLLIVDAAWKSFGIGAEVSAIVSENIPRALKAPIKRLALPDIPAPASNALENAYYLEKNDIIKSIKSIIKKRK